MIKIENFAKNFFPSCCITVEHEITACTKCSQIWQIPRIRELFVHMNSQLVTKMGVIRAALDSRLADWCRALWSTSFLLLKRAQILNVPYIKWAYQIWSVNHLIIKIREEMRPWCNFLKNGPIFNLKPPWESSRSLQFRNMQHFYARELPIAHCPNSRTFHVANISCSTVFRRFQFCRYVVNCRNELEDKVH